MKRKIVVRFLMLLFVLGMSMNAAWASSDILEKLPDGTRTALFTPLYSAQLTGHVSSTGGGKVYVSSTDGEPTAEQYDETSTALAGMAVSMQGMEVMQVPFWAWQKADDGYCFAGWSFADKGTDLGLGDETYHRYVDTYDVSKEMAEVTKEDGQITGITEYKPLMYDIYATFEPIYIVGYEISGSNTIIEGNSCTQTVTFTLRGEGIDAADFNAPAITSSTGGGSWTNASGSTLSISDLSVDGTTAEVKIKFTAPNQNVAEYTANLQLKTKANITMNVLLGARLIAEGVEAIRLNKSKVQQEAGDLTELLGHAEAGDIVKLNGDYNKAVSINKNITFDLNGYEFSKTLTISGGDVTIAHSPYGGSASALDVTGGKAILNGGTFGSLTIGASGAVEQNGATISGTATNNGILKTIDGIFQSGLSSTGTLTVNGGTFDGDKAIHVNGGSAQIQKGTIIGTSYGVQTNGGSTTIEKLAVIEGGNKALNGVGGTLTVNNGKFTDPDNLKDGSVTFIAGYFKTNNSEETQVLGKPVWRNTSGAEFREGYEFFVGSAESARAAGVSVCHIGSTSYASLEEALAYANNTNDQVVIILDNDYTLPAGFYTLPDNATLIIPMSNEQGDEYKTIERVVSTDNIRSEDQTAVWVKPTKFRKLTLANGVNWDVHGTIEVSCSQYSTDERFTGTPYGPYGQLQLNPGSKMILQDGAELRAWGYVTGDIEHMENDSVLSGEIDARRGSMVREQFQMGDWKGAYFSGMGLLEGNTVFPLTTYFIQNVEVPVKYHPGAALSATTGVSAYIMFNISMSANDVQIIGKDGDVAMFLMNEKADAENTWVRKFYDAKHDQQVYEINSGAHIGSMVIPLVNSPYLGSVVGMLKPAYADRIPNDLTMNSGQYFLPITNNFKLHLLSGTMDFTQSTELLPGSEVEIDKGGTAQISADDPNDNIQGGYLFVYDKNEWGNYAGGQPTRLVKYAPAFNGEPTTRGELQSASINVHGTFDCYGGQVYVSESGANIFSYVEDAGTFLFSEDATNEVIEVNQVTGTTGGGQEPKNFVSVKLKNANGGYTESYIDVDHHAKEDDAYCYIDIDGTGARWTSLVQDGCFMVGEANDIYYYAKPQEYVAVTSNEADPNTHTYSDAAGSGRLFILLTNEYGYDCQWWEVEAKNNYFHCIHPENDTYYEWNDGESRWEEVRFEITWLDWNGEPIVDSEDEPVVYEVPYGTQAEWLSTNPTREKTDDYTYTFTGWSPALGKVTSDVTYTATYQQDTIKYTVTFVQEGGVEIERHLLARNEFPVCENAPTRTGFILEWTPALAAVTGNQTYTATWLPEPPTEYEIKFMDYDGTTELQKGNVAVGAVPTPPADPTGKPETEEYTYVFDHWSPALEEVSATSAKIYTAVYREEAQTYTVVFLKEGSKADDYTEADIIESHEYAFGETPVCANAPTLPDEADTDQYTYTLAWDPQIQTVTSDQVYVAYFDEVVNKYTVSVRSNPAGACEVWGSGIYEYNAASDAIEIGFDYEESEWTFDGWSDDLANKATSRQMAVTGDITLVANFTYKGIEEETATISWKNGNAVLLSGVQKKNTPTVYTGETPTKQASAESIFTFDGWATTEDGALAYKKGQTPWATEDATYYAHFAATPATYTISWMNEAGTSAIEVDYDQPYEETTVFNGAAPTKQATAAATFTFDGWATEANGEKVYNIGATPAVSGTVSYYAHYAATPKTYTVTWKRDDGSLLGSTEVAYGVIPSYEGTPTKPATPQYSYTFEAWDREFEPVEGLTTYTASFTSTANTHTVTWLDGDGNTLDTDVLAYGATPSYDGETPTKSTSALYIYTFNGTWSPSIVPVNGDATYTAQFDETPNPDSNIEIGIDDSEDLNDEVIERTNLVITSNGINASGELLGAENLTITGEAVFRMEKDFAAQTWYAVAVPWTVALDGIRDNSGNAFATNDVYMLEFDAEAYASADRETGRNDYWKFLDLNGHDMQPGQLYMIWFRNAQTAVQFYKKDGETIWNTETSVTTTAGEGPQANWNGIANPALYHADLSTGATDVLKYNGNDAYVIGTTTNMIVGEPVFVQVETPNPNVTAEVATGGASYAPAYRRAQQTAETGNRFVVELTGNGKLADRMIVQTAEEKADTYVIGKDLAKMSLSAQNAQMWINRYDAKLCKNTVALQSESVEYPLHIAAPQAGGYVLSALQERGDATLYLTYDGEAIWNLSESDYVLQLEKGTTANYGLRISVKKTPTGIDEAVVDAQGKIEKVLVNDNVFIIRGNQVYSIDGQLVR